MESLLIFYSWMIVCFQQVFVDNSGFKAKDLDTFG